MKNLILLLKLRSWVSKTLQAGGIVALLGQVVLWVRSEDGMDMLTWLANILNVTTADVAGFIITVIGIIMLILRTVTIKALGDK